MVGMQGLMAQQDSTQYHRIDGAAIYDHDPATQLGDDILVHVIADFENDAPARSAHTEDPCAWSTLDGNIAAFHTNSATTI